MQLERVSLELSGSVHPSRKTARRHTLLIRQPGAAGILSQAMNPLVASSVYQSPSTPGEGSTTGVAQPARILSLLGSPPLATGVKECPFRHGPRSPTAPIMPTNTASATRC